MDKIVALSVYHNGWVKIVMNVRQLGSEKIVTNVQLDIMGKIVEVYFLDILVFNICSFLKPHIMKVGRSVYLLQNGMDDSPTCGNIKFRRIFHPTQNQLTLWPFES